MTPPVLVNPYRYASAGTSPTVSDTFTRANGSLGTADTGQTWSTSGAGWAVGSNAAVFTGGSDTSAVINSGLTDNYEIQFTVTALTGNFPFAIVLRGSSTSSYTKIYRNNTAGTWIKLQGSGTAFSSTSSPNPVAGDVIKVRVTSSVPSLYVNGSLVYTYTSAEMTAGSFQGFIGSGGLGVTIDNFTVTAV